MADHVSGYDIIDTAVKIGLGALIGGGVTLLQSTITHRRELEKDLVRRRMDWLQEIVVDFAKAHRKFVDYFVATNKLSQVIKQGTLSTDKEGQKLFETIESSKDMAYDLKLVEARLRLLGEDEAADIVAEYAGKLVELDKKYQISDGGAAPLTELTPIVIIADRFWKQLGSSYSAPQK